MPTSREVQAQINALRADLGIAGPTSADVRAQIQQLNSELSMLPMTMDEFVQKRNADKAMALSEQAAIFGKGVVDGVGILAGQGYDAVGELFDKGMEIETLGDIFYVGRKDFGRFAKTLGQAAMDKIGNYSEEEEIEREYKRYRENFDYNTKVRPAMLASDEVEYKKITDFGANFVDPFLIFPVAKLGSLATRAPIVAAQKAATAGATAARSRGLVNLAKVAKTADKGLQKLGKGIDIAGKVGAYPTELASKATAYGLRKGFKGLAGGAGYTLKGIGAVGAATEKVASAPRRAVASLAGKLKGVSEGVPGAAAFGGQVAGAAGGIPGFLELGIAEGVGIMAKKIGREGGELLKSFATPGSSKRFLYRVATNEKVSPASRKLATIAYDNFGTAIGDGLFNALSNGLTVAGINSGLAGLAGEDAYGSGAAAGSGLVAGGIVPMGPARTQGGKSIVARETQTIDNHMKMKLTEDQRTMFKKLPKSAQVFLATLQEANIGAPKFLIMEDNAYLTMLNKDRESKGLDLLDRAPAGHFNKESKTVFLNENRINKSAQVGIEITAHETGHAFLYQALGNDPTMLQLLLEGYKTTEDKGTPFYFQYDMEGNPVGDPIYLNDQAVQIATDYSRKQKGIDIGRNASKLAQEIGADQFAMMFSKNPNVFEQFHPRLRRMLIDSTRRLLTAVGIAEPVTGNPLTNPISKIQLNSPVLKRLYSNYGKARALELNEKGNLAENGMQITPKKGQTGEDRYTELFGGQGLSLRDAKNLAVTNKSLNRELQNLKKKYKDEPADTWSVTKNGKFVGKNLLPDLRTIFTRNDPFGNVANILDALQEAITQRIGIRFGYRSGTKGKYQNPFRIRDVAIYGYEVSGRDRPNLKVLGYDQAVVRNNIQVLVEKGYIKNQAEFMRQLEDQGQKALEDPEGRINPEGRKENELMTLAFGLKESAGNIASPGLRDLLESKAVKKSFRSYDVEALAGLTKGRNKAFAFDYNNIRDNYNPFRQTDDNLYIPTEEADMPNLVKAIRENTDGFTMDLKARFAKGGFVVAPSKATEFVIDQNKLDNDSLRGYLEKHASLFEREGAHLGGWFDDKTGRYMLDVAFPLSYNDAVRHAMWGDQDAIFDLSTFTEIRTRNERTQKVEPPEGFPESLEQILEQRPSDIGSSAERSFRESSPIRNESIESIRRRAEGTQSEVRQPSSPETRGTEVDDNLFMPALQDARALVEQQGRVAIGTEEVFFQKFLPKLLRKVGGQVKQSTRSIREGARRAIEDVLPFMRDNPQFTDYYNNDMKLTRSELENVFGGITDDQFLFFRLALGLTSPNTQLPANVGEAVGATNHFVKNGNLDAVKMGRSEKGNVVLKETPFNLGGPPRGTKARTLKIVDRLIKEKGSVQEAADFLMEGVSRNELNKFNKEMGYAGDVAKFSDIQRIVELATGQGKLIPRMFIFGPKVGAYTLNAIGRHEYNTIDVWEARFIRSYFKGMFNDNTGLPANVNEHTFMARFTEIFKEEFERMTGETLDPSALQATRWFFMIDTAKRLGYSKAATNETISGYTKRYITELGLDKGSGGQSDGTPNEGVSSQTQDQGGQFLPTGGRTNRVFQRTRQPSGVNRFLAPAAVAAGGMELSERFRGKI